MLQHLGKVAIAAALIGLGSLGAHFLGGTDTGSSGNQPPALCRQHPERCPTTGATATTAPTTDPTTAPTTTSATTTTPAPGSQAFGFSESQGPGSVDAMTDAQLDAHFSAERNAGASIVRLTVDTTSDPQFSNQKLHAERAGLRVLAVIAGGTGTGATVYAARAQWAAATFPGLKIELGNEWNIHSFTPTLAAQYQIAAYDAVKSVCSSCVVVSNGLANWGQYSGGSTNPVRYLELMYAAGLGGHFDELGIHPYLFNDDWTAAQMLDLTNAYSGFAQLASTSPSLRSVMVANGDGAKKITATEWGAPTDDSADGFTAGVSPAEQANLMTQGIAMWKTFPWAGDLLVYEDADICAGSSDQCHFGLVDWNGTGKPALAAFTLAVSSG